MYDLLEGIRVIEVASWTFVPAAGRVLAEWGADVIKIENPATGDPQRGLVNAVSNAGGVNPMTEVPNIGKRGVGLDIATVEGREVLFEMVKKSDVFLTNYLPAIRTKLGIDVADIQKINPKIVYARGTGQGRLGAEAERGGFDLASAWARGGIANLMTAPGEGNLPPFQPGSVGDLSAGINLAGAIAAALVRRERTGKGAIVDTSLYNSGMWITGQAIAAAPLGKQAPQMTRETVFNPLVNFFPTKDGRAICLVMLQADRWWPDLANHMGISEMGTDPRYSTSAARLENRVEFVAMLDNVFRTKDLAEWREILMTTEGVWAPVLSPLEISQDPQAIDNGYLPAVAIDDSHSYHAVASPSQFDEVLPHGLRRCPELGEHTDEVLAEFGYDWDKIIEMKVAGFIN